jgi:hypothetical protein
MANARAYKGLLSWLPHVTGESIMDFFALTLPPAMMVAIIFAVAFLLIGIPVHLCRGSAARDVWGKLAGLFAGLLYMAFILSVYPNVHGGGQQAVTKVSVEHEADTKRR